MPAKINHLAIVSEKYALAGKFYESMFGMQTSSNARPARGLAKLRTPLPQKLMELLPGVDVRIVAERSQRQADDNE